METGANGEDQPRMGLTRLRLESNRRRANAVSVWPLQGREHFMARYVGFLYGYLLYCQSDNRGRTVTATRQIVNDYRRRLRPHSPMGSVPHFSKVNSIGPGPNWISKASASMRKKAN